MDANLSSDQIQMIQNLIDEAVKPLREQVEKLKDNLVDLGMRLEDYASTDHVERSENSFNSQLYQVKNDISNLEYRASDIERKAERAQSAADDARRGARGYY